MTGSISGYQGRLGQGKQLNCLRPFDDHLTSPVHTVDRSFSGGWLLPVTAKEKRPPKFSSRYGLISQRPIVGGVAHFARSAAPPAGQKIDTNVSFDWQAMASSAFTDRMRPEGGPAGPVGPAAPITPAGPAGPIAPTSPLSPFGPDCLGLLAALAGPVRRLGLGRPVSLARLEHPAGPQVRRLPPHPWDQPVPDPFRKPKLKAPHRSQQLKRSFSFGKSPSKDTPEALKTPTDIVAKKTREDEREPSLSAKI